MSSDSSSSASAPLTPESTGSQWHGSPNLSESQSQRQLRQVAFYPNLNATNKPVKPFSRSAARRESVMMLGSIEHLQHYFTKTGLAADKSTLNMPNKGLVPALGGLTELKTVLPRFELPPSPPVPKVSKPAFPHHVKAFEVDPENLSLEMIADLESVAQIWCLNERKNDHPDQASLGVSPKGKEKSSDDFDVLKALKTSTHAIRSVRNYVVSLPSESTGVSRVHYRPQTLSSSPIPKRHVSSPSTTSISLTRIRRAALGVLSVLRELEESSRLPLSDEAYDIQSDADPQDPISRVASPSNFSDDQEYSELPSFTLVYVQGRSDSVPVWEELEDDFNESPEEQKREGWDERLVLSSGWLYKQVRLEWLEKERQELRNYLDVVDEVLFGGPKDGRRGWEKERDRRLKSRRVSAGDIDRNAAPSPTPLPIRRTVSTGALDGTITEEPAEMDVISEEPSVEDDDLPAWAKRTTFEGNPLGRAYTVLVALLPPHLLRTLTIDSSDRNAFLHRISSGQALCVAYNTGVRLSRRPWGYISKDAIHDIVALKAAAATETEETVKPGGWTFRRSDNLRLWIAALKLRYLLPIVGPVSDTKTESRTNTPSPTPISSPMKNRYRAEESPILFNASVVARREEGWEDMLEKVLHRWVDAVVGERRGER